MKYIKDNTILNEGQSFVIDNKRVINPKHQDYIDAGFEVYEEPTIEITLEDAIQAKIAEIEEYYNSDEINLVSIHGIDIYLDPDLRQKIEERISSAKKLGKTEVTLSYNGYKFPMTTEEAELLLATIIDQYGQAYDIKDDKIILIKSLDNIEAIQAYDAKSGYPTKLVL